MLIEALVPDDSIYAFPALTPQGPGAWHFGLFNLPELPEGLIAGRGQLFLKAFIRSYAANQDAITDEALTEYARTYADPAHLKACVAYFRAFHQDIDDNRELFKNRLSMPVLALGAEYSLGTRVLDQVQDLAVNVGGGVVPGVGHWIPEEAPQEVTQALLTFFVRS